MKHLALATAMLVALSAPVVAAHAATSAAAAAKKPAHAASSAPAASKPAAAKKAAAPKKAPASEQAAAKPKTAAKKKTASKTPSRKTAAAQPAPPPTETLTPAELETAKRIYVGNIPCELGAHLLVASDTTHPGFFNISAGKRAYYMHPVESRTGTVRMEDEKNQGVFFQLSNKSMLMDQKAGQRVVDECQSPEQAVFTAQMKEHPLPNPLWNDPPKQ